MNRYFVILTMQRGMEPQTERCILSAEHRENPEDLFELALERLVTRTRNDGLRDGAVLCFEIYPIADLGGRG